MTHKHHALKDITRSQQTNKTTSVLVLLAAIAGVWFNYVTA
jgi:uncharacterized membrane protein YqjE